jgi:Zn-dependent peptidase ImmA (M78 family)
MDAQTAVKFDLETFKNKGGRIVYPFPVEEFALRVFDLDIQYEDFNEIFSLSGYDAGDLFGCLYPDNCPFQGLDKIILINSARKPFVLYGKEIPKEYWADHADRQTIAHEIGHYSDRYVHNRDIQLGLFDPLIIADDPASIIVYPVGEETFANKYARSLLMDEDEVRKFITKKGIAGTFDINTVIYEMRELFGVTQYMAEIRLHELGIHFYNGIYIKKRNRFPYQDYTENSLLTLIDVAKEYDMVHPYYDTDNFAKKYNLITGETRASAALYYAFSRILKGKYDKRFPSVFEKRVAELADFNLDKFNISEIDNYLG